MASPYANWWRQRRAAGDRSASEGLASNAWVISPHTRAMAHDTLWHREYWETDSPGRPMRWRQGIRCKLRAQVVLRRSNLDKFGVEVDNFSRHGCCLTFVDEPALDERVSIKFDGLELLGATVCWIRHRQVGIEFEKPLHEAVFNHLVQKLGARCPERG